MNNMKKLLLLICISVCFIACTKNNEPEIKEKPLFVEPYLGWNANAIEVQQAMEKRQFVLDRTYTEKEGLRFLPQGAEQYVYTEIHKDKYAFAILPFDTLKVTKNEVDRFIKANYHFVRTTNGVNIYGTKDLKTLVYATSVYNDADKFVWYCVTFAPRSE